MQRPSAGPTRRSRGGERPGCDAAAVTFPEHAGHVRQAGADRPGTRARISPLDADLSPAAVREIYPEASDESRDLDAPGGRTMAAGAARCLRVRAPSLLPDSFFRDPDRNAGLTTVPDCFKKWLDRPNPGTAVQCIRAGLSALENDPCSSQPRAVGPAELVCLTSPTSASFFLAGCLSFRVSTTRIRRRKSCDELPTQKVRSTSRTGTVGTIHPARIRRIPR